MESLSTNTRTAGFDYTKAAWTLISISFALKMAVGYFISDTFTHRGNSYTMLNAIALNLAQKGEFSIVEGMPSIDYEPIYPFMLALGYKVFGFNWLGVTLLQGVLYALTSMMLYVIGTRLRDSLAGFLACAYHSFYPFLFMQSLSVIDTTQFVFFVYLMFYIVIKEEDHYVSHYLLAGCVAALCMLSRGSALALLPPILLFMFFNKSRLSIIKRVLITTAAIILVLAPWVTRSYSLSGKAVISAHGGFGLWQGNNTYTLEFMENDISLDEVYKQVPAPEIYREYPLEPRSPAEAIRVAGLYSAAAKEFISHHPVEFIKLAWLKFEKFWSPFYNPLGKDYLYGGNKIRLTVYFVSFLPLLLFLFPGLIYLYKHERIAFFIFAGTLASYTAAHMIVMGYTRLRLPLDPALMIIAGIAISSLREKMCNHQ